MGFVSTPEAGHEAVALGVGALARLAHRGGLDADGKSGDGAGLLIQVPHRLLGGDFAVTALFEWEGRGRQVFESAAATVGIQVADWRSVPVDPETLGGRARETMPGIWHGLIANTSLEPDEWERRLYLARRRAEKLAASEGVRMYVSSCSSRTLVYEGLMGLVPDAWEGRGDIARPVRDFYRYQSIRFEPWDGPAALAFSDGIVVGAALDRNGLRPLRWQRTRNGMVAAASEAGVVTMAPEDVIERGRLGPGQMLLVDTRDGLVLRDAEAKERAAARHDYGMLADRVLVPVERHHVDLDPLEDIAAQHALHGWGTEDVKFVVDVMAETGAEPVYSMGDDIPIAPLGRTPRRIYGYLRQRFAQVTNPAIDPLREKAVMSLRTLLGARRGTLEPEGGADRELLRRHHPAVPIDNKLLELESPFLSAAELTRVLDEATVLDATYAPDESLRDALRRLRTEAGEA